MVRLAAVLIVAAQLVVGVLAPLFEGHAEQSLGVHVEEAGTRLHASHNEASCPSCSARMHFAAPRLPSPAPVLVLGADAPAAGSLQIAPAPRRGPTSSRAPPTSV